MLICYTQLSYFRKIFGNMRRLCSLVRRFTRRQVGRRCCSNEGLRGSEANDTIMDGLSAFN